MYSNSNSMQYLCFVVSEALINDCQSFLFLFTRRNDHSCAYVMVWILQDWKCISLTIEITRFTRIFIEHFHSKSFFRFSSMHNHSCHYLMTSRSKTYFLDDRCMKDYKYFHRNLLVQAIAKYSLFRYTSSLYILYNR